MQRKERLIVANVLLGQLLVLAALCVLGASVGARGEAVIGEDGTRIDRVSVTTRSVIVSPIARAGGSLNVAIVAAAAGDVSAPFFTDPQNRLLASGFFASVAVINAGAVTPTLAELQQYDAVLVWSNFDFADSTALGDALADYVNGGGGVVVAVFSNSSATSGRFLAGRWITHDYTVIPTQSGNITGAATIGTINLPAHPIMAGVTNFSGGTSSFRPSAPAFPDPGVLDIVAHWSDGRTLAVVREDAVGSRVDLGFYPPSDAVFPGFWSGSTDGGLLLANALKFAAERLPLAPGDSDGDGDVDDDDYAKFQDCYTGADTGIVPAGCVTFDFDRDDDVDCVDWVLFTLEWTGPGDPPDIGFCGTDCIDDAGCNDADPCTVNFCTDGFCGQVPAIYGDVDRNGFITLADLFCVLDGFQGDFSVCSFEDDDIEPCGGNGFITIADLFAVLDAFSGQFLCNPC